MFRFSIRDLLLVTVIVVSILIAAPGCYLLNQDLQIIPTRVSHYVTSIYGLPVSNAVIIGCSLSAALCFAVIGLLAFAVKQGGQLPNSSAPAPNPPKP